MRRTYQNRADVARLPGVSRNVPDYMQGEDRDMGVISEVKGWHRWSDRKRLKWLRDYAQLYGQDPEMNTFVAQRILSGRAKSRDYKAQAEAILGWVQQNIYYVNEPGEIIRSPWRTMKEKTGDCDDMAVLMASMAHAIGLPWKYVLAGQHKMSGKPVAYVEGSRYPRGVEFSHIYIQFGWPPFRDKSPLGTVSSRAIPWQPDQTVMSAEPTIEGAPLGYDVVQHGHTTDANGAAQLPEMNRRPVRGAVMRTAGPRRMAGWGQPLTTSTPEPMLPAPVRRESNWFMRVWKGLDWSDLATEAVRATVIAVVVGLFTPGLQARLKRLSKR